MWVSRTPKTSPFQQIIALHPQALLWMITYTRRYAQPYPQITPQARLTVTFLLFVETKIGYSFRMKSNGFTLVELAIVLVILGLITGGIMAGQSIIRASEIRSLAVQYEQYSAAVYAFDDQYMGLPGDLKDATAYWGDNNAACADAATPNGTPGTCNGNGDGLVFSNHTYPAGATQEASQFWNQLALAELISGSYTGLPGSASYFESIPDVNVPPTKVKNGRWAFRYYNTTGVPSHFQVGVVGNHFVAGSDAGGWPHGHLLTPKEAWNIDTKTDDGQPGQGKVLATHWLNCTTAANGNALDATYNLSNTNLVCSFWMRWNH